MGTHNAPLTGHLRVVRSLTGRLDTSAYRTLGMLHSGLATDGVLSPDGSLGAIAARWRDGLWAGRVRCLCEGRVCPVDTTLKLGRRAWLQHEKKKARPVAQQTLKEKGATARAGRAYTGHRVQTYSDPVYV